MTYENPNYPGVIRLVTGYEVHVPPGMNAIKMFVFIETHPNGHKYEMSQSTEGLNRCGWKPRVATIPADFPPKGRG